MNPVQFNAALASGAAHGAASDKMKRLEASNASLLKALKKALPILKKQRDDSPSDPYYIALVAIAQAEGK